jgi:hypothetical protein
MVTDAVRRAVERADADGLKAAVGLLRLTREMGIRVSLETAQELACRAKDVNHPSDQLIELAGLLWLDPALLLGPASA